MGSDSCNAHEESTTLVPTGGADFQVDEYRLDSSFSLIFSDCRNLWYQNWGGGRITINTHV